MTETWDDDGAFEHIADQEVSEIDLQERDPFDLSKALEGAALEHLHPSVKRFKLHSEFEPSGDQPQAIETLIEQLENGQERCICLLYTSPSPRDRTRSRMPSSA